MDMFLRVCLTYLFSFIILNIYSPETMGILGEIEVLSSYLRSCRMLETLYKFMILIIDTPRQILTLREVKV